MSEMTGSTEREFSLVAFLSHDGPGREIVRIKAKKTLFQQGDAAGCIFYLRSGRVKLTVSSSTGKEATIALLTAGSFIGEELILHPATPRLATATAMTLCSALKIDRAEMIRVVHQQHVFSDLFLKYLVARSMRTQADLIDHLFNSSEKRLARILLLMADFGEPGEAQAYIPKISQEMLAEMVGTTRSRVSSFMNRFRKLGYIQYNGRIRINKSLLNSVLYD